MARYFIDMDGTLAKWNRVDYFERLYEKGYYKNLSPMNKVVEAVRKLIAEGEDVYSLSAYLTDSKYALDEKNEWLNEHLPELDHNHRIFVPYGADKSQFIENGINENDYLLDDYTQNLLQWEQSNGTGVKLLNDINHTQGTWQGLFVYHDSSLIAESLMGFNEDHSIKKEGMIFDDIPVSSVLQSYDDYLELRAELADTQTRMLNLMRSPSLVKEEVQILNLQKELDVLYEKLHKYRPLNSLEIDQQQYIKSILDFHLTKKEGIDTIDVCNVKGWLNQEISSYELVENMKWQKKFYEGLKTELPIKKYLNIVSDEVYEIGRVISENETYTISSSDLWKYDLSQNEIGLLAASIDGSILNDESNTITIKYTSLECVNSIHDDTLKSFLQEHENEFFCKTFIEWSCDDHTLRVSNIDFQEKEYIMNDVYSELQLHKRIKDIFIKEGFEDAMEIQLPLMHL